MKTIDIFRRSVNMILDSTPGLLQKTVAKKLNSTVAFEEHAITDLNDFLRGRKNYSLGKQERLAHILGYSYVDLLILGRNSFEKKTTKLQGQRLQKKILLRDGTSCTYATLLKMTEQIFLNKIEGFDIQQSFLIERIIETWKEIEKIKRAI